MPFKSNPHSAARTLLPIAAPIAHEKILTELAKAEVMIDSTPAKPDKGFYVYRAFGREIPQTMQEIGRLREETFRTVGEGTGMARDNDTFDEYYDHFICWDKKSKEITGAYRIGRVDRIIKERGLPGVYTTTLFNLDELLKTDFKEGTLEAGRSFVRPEYQRGLTLIMIWMALARFIVANPEYRNLMGPVSISNEFQENSKHMMVNYLMKQYPHEKSALVTSKNPPQFNSNISAEELMGLVDSSLNLEDLQNFVRQVEGNPKAQIPQLIKLYLELGVRFLAFNKDDAFNSIDGLIWLDVTRVPEQIMLRYMSQDEYTSYRKRHGAI
jgi:putative hemolysin